MNAARISMGYFSEALRRLFVDIGEMHPDLKSEVGGIAWAPAELLPGMKRHSLDELSAAVVHETSARDHVNGELPGHNFEKRVWRESLPVIHLAAAIHVLGRKLKWGDDAYELLLTKPDLLLRVLRLAKVHTEAICHEWEANQRGARRGRTFMIDPAQLIPLSRLGV